MNISPILEKVETIEKNLQELKVRLLLDKANTKELDASADENIVKEVRKTRKRLWNEKYAKIAQNLS